ncbi:hypothetical protein [Actinoallomurus sp. NPDC050550]|uniref:hypothetical protein n=1 Tax=Actinoallomurus sp. NPDC050550 TaxID=3154937 RepID=UPI0033C4291B
MPAIRRFLKATSAIAIAGPLFALSPTAHAQQGNTVSPAYAKAYVNTYAQAPSHYSPSDLSAQAGWLYPGNNYFYCQYNNPDDETYYHGHKNHWWAKTDDDSGNTNVWISEVYMTPGQDDQPAVPFSVLPLC